MQCLDRRIADLDLLNTELAAWQEATTTDQRQVDWQFTRPTPESSFVTYTQIFKCDGLPVRLRL